MDIKAKDLALVQTILRKQVSGCTVWAFGSRVLGTAHFYSDLDLVLLTNQPLDWSILFHLKEAFAESDLPFKVDIVDWASITPAFQALIQKQYEVVIE